MLLVLLAQLQAIQSLLEIAFTALRAIFVTLSQNFSFFKPRMADQLLRANIALCICAPKKELLPLERFLDLNF